MRTRCILLACVCFAALTCPAIGPAQSAETLYARLGGEAGIAGITDTLIDRAAADPVMGPTFKDVKLARIKQHLAEMICQLSDGPCKYEGDSVKEVHAGHHISEAQFYRLVDTLRGVLRERHVELGATNELLAKLAPMKRDVVEEKPVTISAAHAAQLEER